MSASDRDLDRILHGTLLGEGLMHADVAALLADEDGFYVAANDTAVELTGYPRERLTTFRAGELAADEPSKAIYRQMAAGSKLQGRKRVRREDGTVVECRYWGIHTVVSRLPYSLVLLWPAKGPAARAS